MKKFPAVLGLVLVLGIFVWLLVGNKHLPPPASAPSATGNAATSAQPTAAIPNFEAGQSQSAEEKSASTNPSSTIAPALNPSASASASAPVLPPGTVLDNCRVAMHNYHARFGENPIGSNAEITAALRGQNPRQVNFLRDDDGLRVNEQGEMIDAYGTPFFFHQLSADLMEIRSAGTDRKMFTYDDGVTR